MCRPGGPRCDQHRRLTPAQRDKRASNRAYRRDLSDALKERGNPELATLARKASMSSLQGIARAAGMDPEKVSTFPPPGTGPARHQIPEKDVVLISKVEATFKDYVQEFPSPLRSETTDLPPVDGAEVTPETVAELTTGIFGDRCAGDRREWHALRAQVEKAAEDKAAAEESGDPVAIYEAKKKYKDLSLDEFMARRRYEAQEDILAADLEKMMGTDPLFREYNEKGLGTASELAHVEEGSVDWLNLRKQGLGGSQILAAAGFELGSTGKLKRMSEKSRAFALADLLEDKATPATPEDVAPSGSGAGWRGHVWEPALLAQYQKDNPDVVVSTGKATWQGTREHEVINVDGIALDGDGNPTHLIECKNSDAAHKWGNGVPFEYRAQQLYYLEATGLPYADVIARVDGKTQVHRIRRGEAIDGTENGVTIPDLNDEIAETWSKVTEFKKLRQTDPSAKAVRPQVRKPIGNAGHDTRVACDNLAGLLAGKMTRDEVKAELDLRRGAGKGRRPLDECVREMIAEKFVRDELPDLAGIDIETASITSSQDDPRTFRPRWSDVIETGVVHHNARGEEIGRLSRLHDADPRIVEVNGTGAQHVHGITVEEIKGKPRLNEPEENALVRDEILRGGVIVAHNKTFEQDHLHYGLSDFQGKRPWLDTAWLARHFSEPGPGKDGSLRSFCEDNGVEYVNAHRATVDADMMMRALDTFLRKPKWWEIGRG